MKPASTKKRFWLIVVLVVCTTVINIPKNIPIRFSAGPIQLDTTISGPQIDWRIGPIRFSRDLSIKKGLDLQGGTQIVLEADVTHLAESDRQSALESAKSVISRRIDLYGLSETVIQTAKTNDSYRIVVELPGITDPIQAKTLIGQTARLEFREPNPSTIPTERATSESAQLSEAVASLVPTDLTGKDLGRAAVEFDQKSGEPVVALTFTQEGREKFADITKRNVGRRVGIFLDEIPLTIPVVKTPIVDGRAIISGAFTTESAKQLVVNLNAGALPVNLTPISQTKVGATLGKESVEKSVRAGIFGLGIVSVFMILLYRKLGLIADMALIIYGLIILSVYKLIPITLTLPGVAGFLLSIGMATDANILIFERTKEELRRGHNLRAAVELGFGRAWDSIKDANVATLLTAFVLYNPFDWTFLNTSGLIRGFALTLTIGILISLFTGVVVSRTLIRMFYVAAMTKKPDS